MKLSNIVNQLLDKDCLADASASEQAGLTALSQRCNQVDNFDTGFEDFSFIGLFGQRRRLAVNRRPLGAFGNLAAVDWFANYVEHAALCVFANRYADRRTSRCDDLAAAQSVGVLQTNRTYCLLVEMLCYLERNRLLAALDCQRFVYFWQRIIIKLNIDHHAHDLNNFSLVFTHSNSFFYHFIASTPALISVSS